uniref:Uncharacterized protein n=1 Tax=Caenorhabditis japonica TaxID=281687 RepID=A0A8R1DNB7_CAEJA
MSTSALVAQSDLLKQLPSCSYTVPEPANLDVNSWGKIFENVASSMPLRKALEFKTLHSEACYAVNRVFRKVTTLKIQILKATASGNSATYYVQDSPTKNENTAVEMVRFVLANARNVQVLELFIEDFDLFALNRMLDEVVGSDHVSLEKLFVRRRHAGQTITKIGDVIRANAATLREISRVGISEASHGFCDQINLDKFGTMSFDMAFHPPNAIPLHMVRITESGAKFRDFSYTSFAGFDPIDEVVQSMLESAQVKRIKLTMMNPPSIASRPGYMIGKIRRVKRLEVVEIVPEPRRINKLLAWRHIYEKVFPNCNENVFFLQQWQ